MKKTIVLAVTALALLFSSCAHEYNKVYMSNDTQYKYEYAKECFANGKWQRAVSLLTDLIVVQKGSEDATESVFTNVPPNHDLTSRQQSLPSLHFKSISICIPMPSRRQRLSSVCLNCRTSW